MGGAVERPEFAIGIGVTATNRRIRNERAVHIGSRPRLLHFAVNQYTKESC